MARRIVQLALVFTVLASVLAVNPGSALAASPLNSLTEVELAEDDMDSSAEEWSGATHNLDTNVLLTVDDEGRAYQFGLLTNGTINPAATTRLIDLNLGDNDYEGVAWISGEKYAFLNEGSGEVIIATIPAQTSNTTTTVNPGDVERRFPVIWGNWGNLGPEGLATDGNAFYVVREMPATISMFDFDGNFEGSVNLSSELTDAAGVAVLPDGSFLVVSHEDSMMIHLDVDWNLSTFNVHSTRDASAFTQLEGIALTGDTDVYLFGEDNSRNGNPGQTYSHLVGDILTVDYLNSDVNCSGTVDIADALIAAKLGTGSIDPMPGCGSGDHNQDGTINVVDALLIAQCSVGVSNMGCPGTSS